MKISASIVTYNSSHEIATVLESLSQANVSGLEIYVVDNASTDDTCQIVTAQFPQVKLIASQENLGFGGGHNLALSRVDSDYHIFINPDITVERGEIEKMISYMEEHLDAVILTPRVLNTDGTEQFLPKRTPKFKYLFGGRLENKLKAARRWRSEYTMREENVTEPIQVDFCTGCFMLCRTTALKTVGGFDDRYFLYFEDADLTREMQKLGKTMYVPYVFVTHEWKRENGKISKGFFIALCSMFKYFWKWRKDKPQKAAPVSAEQSEKSDAFAHHS